MAASPAADEEIEVVAPVIGGRGIARRLGCAGHGLPPILMMSAA
jgi:hypothetical protein